jgi:nucleoside-diphosphate-sugar epimerase
MHVFVTGATGWVGSAVVKELVAAGHKVTGLARSEEKVAALAATGATVLKGTVDELDKLKAASANADAVAHLAFNHDFSKFAENSQQDKRAIEAIGEAIAGTKKPFLVTSGIAHLASGRLATEADSPPSDPSFPRKSEAAAQALRQQGLRVSAVRLAPSTHGVGDYGFVPNLIKLAREKGVSAYIGEGQNRWAGVHRLDAARVYRLALEQGATEPAYHAIADEGVPFKDIATVIGRRLGLPVESRGPDHFGWFARFAGLEMAASSTRTRKVLDWHPTQPGLLADLDQPGYFAK